MFDSGARMMQQLARRGRLEVKRVGFFANTDRILVATGQHYILCTCTLPTTFNIHHPNPPFACYLFDSSGSASRSAMGYSKSLVLPKIGESVDVGSDIPTMTVVMYVPFHTILSRPPLTCR